MYLRGCCLIAAGSAPKYLKAVPWMGRRFREDSHGVPGLNDNG